MTKASFLIRAALPGDEGLVLSLVRELADYERLENLGCFEWSVLDWNEPSIRFYKSMGARLMKDWRICRVEDEALRRLGALSGKP